MTVIGFVFGLVFAKFDDLPVFIIAGAVLDAFWVIPLVVQ